MKARIGITNGSLQCCACLAWVAETYFRDGNPHGRCLQCFEQRSPRQVSFDAEVFRRLGELPKPPDDDD